MRRIAAAGHALASDARVRAAASLFARMHAAPTTENAERLAQWLGEGPVHVRALDIALTEWGLMQSGHPAGDAGKAGDVAQTDRARGGSVGA
ncbi:MULTISPECIES: hypothetical protein [unclassified Variovorax]|uniref:hypothetical protein n=1 Tax=unclassified Variovorax TaxID=663243 RepID=UPI003F469DB3